MKATPDQIAAVAAVVRPHVAALREHAASLRVTERYAKGFGDLEMRIRWDAWWRLTPRALRESIYADVSLTDGHVDTLLKRVMKEVGLPEFGGAE